MDTFVQNGILALANVVEQESTGWINGHVGASLLAGAALLKSGYLSDAAYESLLLRLHLQSEEAAYLLKPLALSPLTKDYTPVIDAIAKNTQQLSRSGHGVIYGALFLRTVSDNNLRVSENIVLNVAQLISNCSADNWGRYFGVADYRLFHSQARYTLQHLEKTPVDINALCELAIKRSVSHVYFDTDAHFFTGEKIHGITHAHAIYLLHSLGYTELAKQAVPTLLMQLELNDLRPESGLTRVKPKRLDLSDPTVWGVGYTNEHQIKLAQSYVELSQALTLPLSVLDGLWGGVVD